jgi:type VI secretion system protein ImpG
MDARLLQLYRSELGHLREMGSEFAREFPLIAARLGMKGTEVDDPYVERLLEGFAFLAARVQLKLEDEQPRLIAHLLEALYPNFLAPVPAMMVARFGVDPADPNLARGHCVPRGSAIVSELARGQDTHCEFRTAHDVTLWPVELRDVSCFSQAADLSLARVPAAQRTRGGLRIRLRCGGGLLFNQLGMDRLQFHVNAPDSVAYRLHELVTGCTAGTLVISAGASGGASAANWRGPESVRALGFSTDEALLPESLRAFSGYRLLQELAALPQRFLFFEIGDLAERLAAVAADEVELIVLLDRGEVDLEALVDAHSLALYCTPAINLFRKPLDRIAVGPGAWEHHLVPDRARPTDFEVHSVISVTGFGTGRVPRQEFKPLYAAYNRAAPRVDEWGGGGGYTLRRESRVAPARSGREPVSPGGEGEEVWITLVDPSHAPYSDDLRQLAVVAWVSNRHLPALLPITETPAGQSLWRLESAGPVLQVQVVRGPTRPASRRPVGEIGWHLVSHLTLNHLSLVGDSPEGAATALRTMLSLYAPPQDDAWRRQVEAVRSLEVRSVVRRLPFGGPLTFGTGVAIQLGLDELGFQGTSACLFASVLERFFARHAAINSFTQLTLQTPQRGTVRRWPPRTGLREPV